MIPYHGYGLLHKGRPHHGAIKNHILLSVDGTHKQSLCLLCAVLMHVAAQVGLMLEGAHFGKLLVQDIHALHGISLYYNSILTHLQVYCHSSIPCASASMTRSLLSDHVAVGFDVAVTSNSQHFNTQTQGHAHTDKM